MALLSIVYCIPNRGAYISSECRIAESNRSKPSYEDGASTYRPILLVGAGAPLYN